MYLNSAVLQILFKGLLKFLYIAERRWLYTSANSNNCLLKVMLCCKKLITLSSNLSNDSQMPTLSKKKTQLRRKEMDVPVASNEVISGCLISRTFFFVMLTLGCLLSSQVLSDRTSPTPSKSPNAPSRHTPRRNLCKSPTQTYCSRLAPFQMHTK